MSIIPVSELEIGHIYHIRAYDNINVGIWNGKGFVCATNQGDGFVVINHYSESYPLGVAQPLSRLSDKPVNISAINKNILRTLSAADTLHNQLTGKRS